MLSTKAPAAKKKAHSIQAGSVSFIAFRLFSSRQVFWYLWWLDIYSTSSRHTALVISNRRARSLAREFAIIAVAIIAIRVITIARNVTIFRLTFNSIKKYPLTTFFLFVFLFIVFPPPPFSVFAHFISPYLWRGGYALAITTTPKSVLFYPRKNFNSILKSLDIPAIPASFCCPHPTRSINHQKEVKQLHA